MIKILHVGPSITKTKGGIATVINDVIHSKGKGNHIKLSHLVSHVEGSIARKLITLFQALVSLVFKSPGYDILHIHAASDVSFLRKTLFIWIGKAFNKKVILHMHGGDFDIYYRKSPALLKRYIKRALMSCDKIIVLSEYWKTFFQYALPDKQVDVLYNGVHASTFSPYLSAPENIHKFLFMGRLYREKGIYDLIEAVNQLVNVQQHKELLFYIAGNGEIDKVRTLINNLNLSDNVKLLGWIEDQEKLDWLGRVDTVLLPSYIEGLPMSIIEAMAAGKIIISTNVGGIPDLLVEQENGYMTDPGDVEALCDRILHVSSHPEEMTAISRNNIEKVEALYNLPKIHDHLFEMYYELAGKNYAFKSKKLAYKYSVAQSLD